MDKEQLEALFAELLELAPARREQRLTQLRAEQPALADELYSLLSAADQANDFLVQLPLPDGWPGASSRGDEGANGSEQDGATLIGQRIDRYCIQEQLGRGGMGVVYLASRADGQYQQQVALKIIRPSVSAPLREQRFRAERQLLAQLNHPYISRLIDGGSRDNGQPYLVMEYVQGEPINIFCRRCGLALEQRLELFVKVCEAVAYAHQQGVIHRDLKPSNILVQADGTPKLLDFGIAKELNPAGAEQGTPTADSQAPMTPEFAAPEQRQGAKLSFATDVYALGLILHELLIGHRICAGELENGASLPPPSRFISGEQRRRVETDLDRIVGRALAYKAQQRYPMAGALADDIRRFLGHRPALAQESKSSHLLAFFSRYRWSAGLLGLTALALVAIGLTQYPGRVSKTLALVDSQPNSLSESVSPFDLRCAALQQQYDKSKTRSVFSQLVLCQLDSADWHNSRGNHETALQVLTSLMQQRDLDSHDVLPEHLLAEKSRMLAALSQAYAGSGYQRKAARFQRKLAAWQKKQQ